MFKYKLKWIAILILLSLISLGTATNSWAWREKEACSVRWSSDGEKISYIRWRHSLFEILEVFTWESQSTGIPDLYVMNMDGAHRRRIARHVSRYAWSPDGKRIVVQRGGYDLLGTSNSRPELWIMDANGRHKKKLTAHKWEHGDEIRPVWSPDGKKIAFIAPKGLSTINPDGTDEKFIIKTGATPDWSPDGRKFAIGGKKGLDIVDVNTRKRITIIKTNWRRPRRGEGERYCWVAYDWSLDGKRIVYAASGTKSIFVRDLELEKEIKLTDTEEEIFKIAWSPDGERIVFLITHHDTLPKDMSLFSEKWGKLFIINADGSDKKLLAEDAIGKTLFWWPDSSAFIYRSGWKRERALDEFGYGDDDIMIDVQTLKRKKMKYESSKLSPDGTKFLVGVIGGSFWYDINTGEIKHLFATLKKHR